MFVLRVMKIVKRDKIGESTMQISCISWEKDQSLTRIFLTCRA